MRVGFVLAEHGFAAVLYQRALADAEKRSPWFSSSGEALGYGMAWADSLGLPVDVVRVDTKLFGGEMKREQSFPLTNDELAADVAALRAAPTPAPTREQVLARAIHAVLDADDMTDVLHGTGLAETLRAALSSPVGETPKGSDL